MPAAPADENTLRTQSAERFLRLVQERRRGRLKIYLGLAAGAGKTYRMLQEAHDLLAHGVNVLVGYAETHGRAGTEALVAAASPTTSSGPWPATRSTRTFSW